MGVPARTGTGATRRKDPLSVDRSGSMGRAGSALSVPGQLVLGVLVAVVLFAAVPVALEPLALEPLEPELPAPELLLALPPSVPALVALLAPDDPAPAPDFPLRESVR